MTVSSANAGPYSRFYWKFRDEFPDVYANKEAFGWWMTLLAIAEGAHPTAPELPRKVKTSSLSLLVENELVTLLPGDRYRIRGLTAERERRTAEQRNGGTVRAENAQRDANGRFLSSDQQVTPPLEPALDTTAGDQPASNSKDEQSKAETRRDETRTTARASGPEKVASILPDALQEPISVEVRRLQKLAEDLTQQPYVMGNIHGGWAAKAIAEQLPHGFDRVESAWRKVAAQTAAAGSSKPTLRQLVLGADDLLNPVPQQDPRNERERLQKEAFDRRVARTQGYVQELRSTQNEAKEREPA